jgi:mono/diheme cytochrome c family protein
MKRRLVAARARWGRARHRSIIAGLVSRGVAGSVLAFGLLLFGVLGVVGCEPADQTPVGRGARVFARTCSGCHGADGRGVMRLGLVKPPRDLTNPEFHAQVTDEQLRSIIRTGKNQMPAFGGLMGEEDLRNVIAFIRTLPPGAKAPRPSAAMPPPSAAPAGEAAPVEPPAAPPSALVVPPHTPEPKGTVQ